MLDFFLAPYRKQSQIFGLSSEEECDERRWKKKKKVCLNVTILFGGEQNNR